MDDNPWVRRFRVDLTDAELDAYIARPAGRLPDLSAMPADEAMTALQVALLELTVPSEQMRAGIRRLHVIARAGCSQLYPDMTGFLARVYMKDPPPCPLPILCLTGLSGNGKSELFKGFLRTVPDPSSIEVPNHANFRLISAYGLKARSGQGFSEILEPIFPEEVKGKFYSRAQKQLTRDGVGMLLGDEIQFVTQSAGATRAANLILSLAGLGPPFAFACNFSLLHRFVGRPHEQKERMLSDIVMLMPEDVEGPDWEAYIFAVLDIQPAYAELRARRDIPAVFGRYTFGNKRNARRLVVLAYGAARQRGSTVVSFTDLQTAYASFKYASSREDVTLLTEGKVGKLKDRTDLWCPLEAAERVAASRERQAEEIREQQAARAALEASLTAEERSNLADAEAAIGTPPKPEKQKRPKATAGSLASNAVAYANRKKGRGEAA